MTGDKYVETDQWLTVDYDFLIDECRAHTWFRPVTSVRRDEVREEAGMKIDQWLD